MFSYGFMLLITGKYNVQNPVLGADGATSFIPRSRNVSAGPGFTQSGWFFPGFGSFVAIGVFFQHSQRC
jgi:AGCS family alanine or glycine:cation symporter